METRHYKEELSAYANGELAPDQQIAVRDHVADCSECRATYDEIVLGSRLANQLPRADVSDAVWANIVDTLDGNLQERFALIPSNSGFGLRKAFAVAIAFVAVAGLATLVFISLFGGEKVRLLRCIFEH